MSTRDSLTIAVAQPACLAHDVAANVATHAAAVYAARARVVAFPELSLTGYELDADPLPVDDSRLAPLVDACRATGSVALVGAPVDPERDSRDGRPHIAVLAVDGDGARVAYRKQELGDAEAERFAPGPAPSVLEVDGWRLGLAICKDVGMPRHAGATAALGMDAYVAGVLHHASEAALQDERARRVAADHRVWVALAGFAGTTGGGYAHAAGGSGVWAPGGPLVASAGPGVGAMVVTTLLRSAEGAG